MPDTERTQASRQAKEAALLWLVYMLVNVLINATIPFIAGSDVHAWTYSTAKLFLSGVIVYGILFLAAPLTIARGWQTIRQPGFLLPLCLGVLAAGLANVFLGTGAVIVGVLIYLHWRYDLSDFGIRSSGWRGDAVAVLLIMGLYSLPRLLQPVSGTLDFTAGFSAGLFRLLGNPASSVEYFFYFGFIATRLARRVGSIVASVLIGVMYMAHEMTNPEYWYEGVQFGFIFVGVALACGIYLWRRSLIPIWLGDGLSRFLRGMFI